MGNKRLQVVIGDSMEYKGLQGAYKETYKGLKMGYQGPSGLSGILSGLAPVGNHT